jgi:signal transduction histidine kinase/ActR/RegA family two-component response regulator
MGIFDRIRLGMSSRTNPLVSFMLPLLEANTNVTERKGAEKDRTRLATMVEQERSTLALVVACMTDGLMLVDEDHRVTFCNAPAAAMLGTTVDALTGITSDEVFALLRPSLRDAEAVRQSISMRLVERPTYEMVFEGPPRRHLLIQRFSIDGTRTMGVLLHDQTAERELARAKDELVSMVSHELASPATNLVAYAGLLAQHEYSKPERQDMLATMVQEGQRMTAIIQDFLDIQRLEHGRFQLTAHPMELRTLFEHAARVSATDAEHPLTLDVPASLPLVQADPNRVQQVLANLLSNARKYTPPEGRIRLAARQIDGAIEISVTDEGLGIPLEAQPHLFEKFYRVDAEDRRLIKGTGLGLAIVKEIVEALGGRIGAESGGSGHGSRFWFTLPLAGTASGGQDPRDLGRLSEVVLLPPSSALRILVVDDDAAIRNSVRRVLRPDGHHLTLVASAEEALEQCRSQSFDVVLTDLGLGNGLDGWELAGRLRRGWPLIQVILASGSTGIDALEAQRRGVNAVLSKPYQSDDLRRLVVDVGRHAAEQAA